MCIIGYSVFNNAKTIGLTFWWGCVIVLVLKQPGFEKWE